MKFLVVISDEERRANDDHSTFDEAADEIQELLRSGYFDIDSIKEIPDE